MNKVTGGVRAGHEASPITAEELMEMGDIGPCELIEGRLVMMAAAGRRHGRVAAQVVYRLTGFVREGGLGEVSSTETGFIVTRNPDTVRAPDAAFVSASRAAGVSSDDGFWPIAPDIAVEVVSPSDRWTEVLQKAHVWLRAGTCLVWIIDPVARRVHIFRTGRDVQELGDTAELSGEDVLVGFTVKVAELLA